jgi:tungstate transport system ATP-binding protein
MTISTPLLEVSQLTVARSGRLVLDLPHLALAPGEVLAVIGPNGAGKSTLLLALAALLPERRGALAFHGQPVLKRGELAYRRKLGLVLQDPLLLDMSVFDNVAAGLRFRGWSRLDIRLSVTQWLERLGIGALAQRSARQLSGGEAQRVALARAFALEPELLLLDEPFSALDAPTRLRLLADLQALLRATGVTTVFITHDLDEALQLGDRVAVLLEGRLRQVGAPQAVFTAPADAAVAAFVGVETVIPGEVQSSQAGAVHIICPAPDGAPRAVEAIGELPPGQSVLVCLRPEDITLWPAAGPLGSSARNHWPGRIQQLVRQGPLMRVTVDCGLPLQALVTYASSLEMALAEGQPVTAVFKASAVHLIPR